MNLSRFLRPKKIHGVVVVLIAIIVIGSSLWPVPQVHAAFPTNTSILDTFNRSNGTMYGATSSSGGTWSSTCFGAGCTNMAVVSNQVTSTNTSFGTGMMTTSYGPDSEAYATVSTIGVASGNEIFGLAVRGQNIGLGTFTAYLIEVYNGGDIKFRRFNDNGNEILLGTVNVSAIGQTLVAGSSIGLSATGTTNPVLTAWFKPAAGSWQSVGTATDNFSITPPVSNTPFRGGGTIGIEINGNSPRIDDFSGGTIITQAAPATPTLSAPISGNTVTTRPQFELRSTDADSDYLRYKIEVCNVSDCSSILTTIDQTISQTGWASQDTQTATAYVGNSVITGSTMASYIYPDPPLDPNTQYWWRAYAIDPGGTNTWSSASSISTFTTENQDVRITGGTTITGGTKIAN